MMRVCIVYDCLFPNTVGGAERWYRNLAERLAERGHEVTYITLRQWEHADRPMIEGVHVRAVGPRLGLYARGGRRRIWPPLIFGLGVAWHLLRYGRRYDIVHTASFPYFSLLAAGLARLHFDFGLIVDWHEVWTREYWLEYLGSAAGRVGWVVQSLGLRVSQTATCFSQLHARRLREGGVNGKVFVLPGEYAGETAPDVPRRHVKPLVLFAGRHIPEKQVPKIVPALAKAREQIPDLRGIILGDGPERNRVLRSIDLYGLSDTVSAPGFVDGRTVDQLLSEALCLLLPSRREGYGMVILEAAARGTPSIVVSGPDNAATELVDDGANGVISPSAEASDLAAAIYRVYSSPGEMREWTANWFAEHGSQHSLQASVEALEALYVRAAAPKFTHRSSNARGAPRD
jgi:glycosyltransferase involved in cell wall biosynthesis